MLGTQIKSLLLAQEAFLGEGCRRRYPLPKLFRRRLLVLSCRSRGAGSGSELFQIVLQQADFHATTADSLVLALGGSLLRQLGLGFRVDGMLISFVGLGRGQTDAFLGTRIDVLDHLAVGGGQFVELVDAIPDGLGLPLDILLAGKRIQLAPETFMGVWLQRLFAAGSSLSGCGSVLVSWGGLSRLSWGGLSRLSWGGLSRLSWGGLSRLSGRGSILVSRSGLRILSRLA